MSWTVAGVQMDCRLGDVATNRATIQKNLRDAAEQGAQLVVFPECALTGYCFTSRTQLAPFAEPLPGPSTELLAADCRKLNVYAVVGMIEHDPATNRLFNACALIGPNGFIAGYRKAHIPCIGADRFVSPGDRPFATHDLGGLRVGMAICFDASFPETARLLTLADADLIVLPTNWATQARKMADLICRVRALENHVFQLSVNRVGDEGGFHFIGCSSLCDCAGDFVVRAEHDQPAIIVATIDPTVARQKRVVHCAGEYEIDRINWRRPDLYEPLVRPTGRENRPHQS